MFPVDIPGSYLREQGLREMIEEAQKRFEALPEKDQVLHLLCRDLSVVRECAHTYEAQLASARIFITNRYGPRFAARVLRDRTLLKKLRLDRDSFIPPSGNTTVVHTH